MGISLRALGFSAFTVAAIAVAFVACSSSSESPGSFETTDVDGGEQLDRTVGAVCAPNVLVCELDASHTATGNALLCTDGKLAMAFTCPSGEACATLQGTGGVECGPVVLVTLGGACEQESTVACVTDKTAVALCQNGAWVSGHRCGNVGCDFFTGPDGVSRPQCGPDDVYSLGDLCSFPAGHGVCSADGTAQLECGANGKTDVIYDCASLGKSCKNVVVDAGAGVECYPP
jgi:hypothetical protein